MPTTATEGAADRRAPALDLIGFGFGPSEAEVITAASATLGVDVLLLVDHAYSLEDFTAEDLIEAYRAVTADHVGAV